MKDKNKKFIIGVVVLIIIVVIVITIVKSNSSSSSEKQSSNLSINSSESYIVEINSETKDIDNSLQSLFNYDYIKKLAILEYPSENEEWCYNVYTDNSGLYENKFVELTECNIDKKVTSISIPDRIDGFPVICMGDSLLRNYENLENLTIPNTIVDIGNKACYECYSLSNANIPNSVTKIGDAAFTYHNLSGELDIPEGVIEIGESAFYTTNQDGSFSKVVLPKSLDKLHYNAFHADEVVVKNPNLEFVTSYEEDITFNRDAIVYGYSGSTAAKYCAETGNSFKVIK